MREACLEPLRDALQRSREDRRLAERVDQLSLRDVVGAQAVPLCSRDFELDVAPEDLGDRSVPDRPPELAPGRVGHVHARDPRGSASGRRVIGAVVAATRSTSHRCHVARGPRVPTRVTRRRVTEGESVCLVVAVDGVRLRYALSRAPAVPPMRFVGSGADG